jgi:hypothetical protein
MSLRQAITGLHLSNSVGPFLMVDFTLRARRGFRMKHRSLSSACDLSSKGRFLMPDASSRQFLFTHLRLTSGNWQTLSDRLSNTMPR